MRRLSLLCVLAVATLLGYGAAGPYLAISAISDAVRSEDATALAKQIDFPPLRESLKRQLRDATLRKAGADTQASLLGGFGVAIAGQLSDVAVDAMVTPIGIGALMEGHKSWNRLSGVAPPTRDTARDRPDPFADASRRFESLSRFTVTVEGSDGSPVVFVLTRKGLRWKLSDIRIA